MTAGIFSHDIDADMDENAIDENQAQDSAAESTLTLEGFFHSPFPAYKDYSGGGEGEESVPLWLITFTDTIGLMLTFFVMLYAMSAPNPKMYEDVTSSLSGDNSRKYSKPYFNGPEDTITIDKIRTSKALDLSYLRAMISSQLKEDNLKNVSLFERDNSLYISMPSDLLFDEGSAELKDKAKTALQSLVHSLLRIRNRIEVLGHTDPRPAEGKDSGVFKNNWQISLARAQAVSGFMSETGYKRPIIVRGAAAAYFEELPKTIEISDRYARSRRVDIVVMSDELGQKFIE